MGISLVAQTNSTITNIPFDFEVGAHRLHAGRYKMWTSPDTATLLFIAGIDQKCNLVTLVNSVESQGPHVLPTLVFYKYGERYRLHEVWAAGRRTGRELPISLNQESGHLPKRLFQRVVVYASTH
jgi:hypothetical protein